MQVGSSVRCQCSAGVSPARQLAAPSVRTNLISKTVQLSVRHPDRRTTRPCVHKVQASSVQSSVDTEVDTDNKFKFTNSISENSFEVRGDIEKIFQYAADFSHIDKWDSGTTDAKLRESSTRPALKLGDTVSLMTVLFGVKSSTLYQLLEMARPHKVVFFGVSRFHESTDTVTFQRKPGHENVVQVNYKTDIELIRWYRLFQPILGFVMANLAKEAVEGMQKKLQELQEQGKFAPEKTAAAR